MPLIRAIRGNQNRIIFVNYYMFGIYLLEKYGELCTHVVRDRLTFGAALLGASGLLWALWRAAEHIITGVL